jgi:Membrane bound O-acyl transferase family
MLPLCRPALHGTTPSFLERDLQTYCGYYAAIVPFEYDPETGRPVKATSMYLLKKIARLFSTMALIVIAYSLMMPHNYAPFPSPSQPQSFTSIVDWFHWGHLLNNLVVAGVTSLSLDGGTLGVGLGISLLSGCRTISVMDSPILCSTSPSDFWSLRWNRLVHELLKRGVYLPCRQYGPRSVAAIVTFLASGVLHEYVLSVISWKGKLYSDPSNYVPLHGSHLLFFIWNGVVMLAEYAVGGTAVMNGIQKFPRPVLTCLTLMTVLPASHLFTDEYIASGFFSDYSIGYPIIVRLP